jgi:hypothetical protein
MERIYKKKAVGGKNKRKTKRKQNKKRKNTRKRF